MILKQWVRKGRIGIAAGCLWGCGSDKEGTSPPPDAGVETLHGCDASKYADRSAAAADRRIGFGTALESPALGYSPACMTITAGQSVTFVGSFSTHPLAPGEFQGNRGTLPTPIERRTSGQEDAVFTFSSPGLYPYYCESHAPTMVGVIRVRAP
jgi:plastocyanin